MDYNFEMCDKYIKPKIKYKQLKSKYHKEFDKFKHILLSLTDFDLNDVDELSHLYIIEYKKNSIFIL